MLVRLQNVVWLHTQLFFSSDFSYVLSVEKTGVKYIYIFEYTYSLVPI